MKNKNVVGEMLRSKYFTLTHFKRFGRLLKDAYVWQQSLIKCCASKLLPKSSQIICIFRITVTNKILALNAGLCKNGKGMT